MRHACAAALGLLVLLACSGEGAPGPPPMPPPVSLEAPAPAATAAFRLRLTGGLAGGKEGETWLLAGDRDWLALWSLPAAGPAALQWSRGELPGGAGPAALTLPAGDAAFTGSVAAFLGVRHPEVVALLRGLPGQAALLERSLEVPEDPDRAWALAAGLALLETAAALPGRLLGEAEVALGRDRLERNILDCRLQAAPPLWEPRWRQPWHLRGLPDGVAFLRLELPAEVLWPGILARLERWGLPAPPAQEVDPALEVHFLALDGKPCLVLAVPAAWAPPEDLLSGEDGLLALIPGLDLVAGSWGFTTFRSQGALVLVLGAAGASATVRDDLEVDRPLPFAELRQRWPRGGLGLVVDLDGIQAVLQASSPLPLPLPAAPPRASGRLVEFLAVAEGGAIRIHGTWPGDPSPGSTSGTLLGDGLGLSERAASEVLAWILGADVAAALRRAGEAD